MRLSWNPSANLFVFGDFNVHHQDWANYSGGTDRSGELCYNFSVSNDLTQVNNFPTQISDCDSHSPILLDYFFLLMLIFVLQWLFLHWENLIMLLFQFLLNFHQIHNGMPHFIAKLMTILIMTGAVFMIIWEIFHRRISLNSVLLVLLNNFVSGFRLELIYMYIYIYPLS